MLQTYYWPWMVSLLDDRGVQRFMGLRMYTSFRVDLALEQGQTGHKLQIETFWELYLYIYISH